MTHKKNKAEEVLNFYKHNYNNTIPHSAYGNNLVTAGIVLMILAYVLWFLHLIALVVIVLMKILFYFRSIVFTEFKYEFPSLVLKCILSKIFYFICKYNLPKEPQTAGEFSYRNAHKSGIHYNLLDVASTLVNVFLHR